MSEDAKKETNQVTVDVDVFCVPQPKGPDGPYPGVKQEYRQYMFSCLETQMLDDIEILNFLGGFGWIVVGIQTPIRLPSGMMSADGKTPIFRNAMKCLVRRPIIEEVAEAAADAKT